MNNTKKIIPQFSAPGGTIVEDYQRFFYLSSYLKSCSKDLDLQFKKSNHFQPLAKACKLSPRKIQSLYGLQKAWNSADGVDIPLGYLDYIGAKKDIIEEAAEKDLALFHYFAEQNLSPKTYTLRLIPAVYTGGSLPEGLTIEEAEKYMRERLSEKNATNLHFSFNFPELKTVFFKPDGTNSTVWYTPIIEWTKEYLRTSGSGRFHGKSFLR